MEKNRRTRWLSASAAIAVVGLVSLAGWLAVRGAHDREKLLSTFAEERLNLLRGEIRDIEVDVNDIREHLEIAAGVLTTTVTPELERHELETVLAVVQSFELMAIHDESGRQRIVELDDVTPPPEGERAFRDQLAALAVLAIRRGRSTVSPPLGDGGAAWYRAFAAPLRRKDRAEAVVLLVNLRRMFERLRIGVGGSSAVVLIADGDAPVAVLSEPGKSPVALSADAGAELLRRVRAGQPGTWVLPRAGWSAIPDGVAAFAPIETGMGARWGVGVLSSTAFLRAQERAIVVRTLMFSGAVFLALITVGAYVVTTARRTIAMRERLRSAEQLAHHAEMSEKILENVPVGVIVLDAAGRVSSMNRSARARVPPGAFGEPVERAFAAAPPDAMEELRSLLARAQESGVVQSSVGEPLALSGRGTYFAAHVVPLAHPTPELHMLLVFEDVTELRALASQLLRAEKLATVGVLAAGFAHEVGTPLGVMRGRAEMLVSKLSADGAGARNATVIVEEIDRISRTIRDLLDFSRATPAATRSAVALDGLVANVVELLRIEAGRRGVTLEVDVPAKLPPLAADQDQLKQVLVNLAMNSLDASAPGGRVTLRAREEAGGGRAVIEVEDDGAGIPEEHRHRVFDPFFTTKKRGKGTGLGLAVVARIVRSHAGELDLESAVARGTRIVVTWPLA